MNSGTTHWHLLASYVLSRTISLSIAGLVLGSSWATEDACNEQCFRQTSVVIFVGKILPSRGVGSTDDGDFFVMDVGVQRYSTFNVGLEFSEVADLKAKKEVLMSNPN